MVGLGGVFTAAAVGGVLVHLDLPPARDLARRTVNDVLRSSLRGEVEIARVDHLSLRDLDVGAVSVRHPGGEEVLRATDVHATFSALAIARGLLFGEGDLVVGVSRLRIGHADVVLDQGDGDELKLLEALSSPPEPEPSQPGRPVRVELSRVEIEGAWVRGALSPSQAVDASVEELVGSLVSGPEQTTLDLERVRFVERRLLPVPVTGRAQGRVRMAEGKPLEAAGEVSGSAGDVEIAAKGSLQDDRLSATVTAPRVTPAAVAAIQPGLPVHQPLSVAVSAEGALSQLDVTARVGVLAVEGAGDSPGGTGPAGGEIVASARLDALSPKHVAARAEVRDLDPRAFAPAAPAMRASAQAQATISLGEGPPRVVAEARTEPTVVEGQAVPAIDVRGTFKGGELRGSATIHEPGAPIRAEVVLSEEGGIRLDARSEIPSLGAVPRLQGSDLGGRAGLHVAGTLRNGRLDATLEARVDGLTMGRDLGLGQGRLTANVRGSLEAPRVQAAFQGASLKAARYTFERVAVGAEGPATAPRVVLALAGGDRRIGASAELDVQRGEARRIQVEVARGEDAIGGRIARVGWSRGIDVEGLALEGDGAGAIEGGLSVQQGRIEGELRGTALDLGRLADIAGVEAPLGGVANVDVALHGMGRGRKGHVRLELEDGAVPGVAPRLSVNVTARVEGEDLEAGGFVRVVVPPRGPERARAAAPAQGAAPAAARTAAGSAAPLPCQGTIASVVLDKGRAKLRGSILDARTWQSATGSIRVVADDWQLRCLSETSPVALPVRVVDGRLTARLDLSRGERQRFPSARDVLIRTRGLRVAGPTDPRTRKLAWSPVALDVRLAGDLDGETGETRASFSVLDRRALLAELSGAFGLDLQTLVDRPAERRAALERMRVAAHLALPRRRLDDLGGLPPDMQSSLPSMTGAAQLDAYVAGTLGDPRVVVRGIGWKVGPGVLGAPGRDGLQGSLDLDSLFTYDGREAKLDAYALRAGRNLMTATAKVQADLAAVLARKPGEELPWSGGLEARLYDIPLGEIPFLADREIGGYVRGDIAVRGLFNAPEVAVHLEIPGLKFGPGGYFETAEVALDIAPPRDGQPSLATAKVALGAHDGGRLDVNARTQIAWKAGALPVLKEDQRAEIALKVARFRLATLEPLVAGQLSRLDGYLDGAVRLGLGPEAGFTGQMRLSEGVFQIPAIGQAFEKASFQVTATPSGELRIKDIRAEALHGLVVGDAAVQMKGLAFQSARAELSIPDNRDLPITLEGVPFGEARGRIVLSARNRGDEIAMDVEIPKLRLTLPNAIGRSVQSLEENEDISTSAPLSQEDYEARIRPEREAEELQASGTPLVIQVRLGDIRVEGEQVQASITGDPRNPVRIKLGGETRVGGDIRIVSGKLEVLGKEFIIEPSLVHLREEDAANPYLNVTAYHDADDGTRIYIDYIGQLQPITEDKIKFRSDPARPKNELIAQLLFGSDLDNGTLAGGATGAQKPAGASGSPVGGAAAGVGAGVASAQLNTILQSIGPLQHFETNLSTTDEGTLKTSLGYQLGERVTATASYEDTSGGQGQSVGGTAPSPKNQTEVSVEWRFVRDWILRAAFGIGESQSTSLDVIWKHRY